MWGFTYTQHIFAQATIAALSNNSAVVSSSKDAAAPRTSLQQTAQGKSAIVIDDCDDSGPSPRVAREVNVALETLVSRLAAVDQRDTKASSAIFLRCRVALNEPMISSSAPIQLGNRVDYLFNERQAGITVSVKELVTMRVLYWLDMSPSMANLLLGTPFLQDPAGILEDIFMGKWKIPGFLSNASASTSSKACVTVFLKSYETPTSAQHVLNGHIRLLQVLGHIFGPDAYRPWLQTYQHSLPEMTPVAQIHPKAMVELCNNHVHGFFSVHQTNLIKSFVERGGTIAQYISANMVLMPTQVEALTASSFRHLTEDFLKSQGMVASPLAVQSSKRPTKRPTPQGTSQGTSKPLRPMAALKGFCLTWLQADVMPCTNTKCSAAATSSSRHLKHRQEFDALPAVQRSAIVAEAKKLTPSGIVKVVA